MNTRAKTKRPRGISKQNGTLIGGYMPQAMVTVIDSAVKALDTDRSKFIRTAVREKLERHGYAA